MRTTRSWISILGFLFVGIALFITLQSFTTVDDSGSTEDYIDEIQGTKVEIDGMCDTVQGESQLKMIENGAVADKKVEFEFAHPSPIVINTYQIESMQGVLTVKYYDANGKQISKDEVGQGIYIARIFMTDGSLETIKFYSQQ